MNLDNVGQHFRTKPYPLEAFDEQIKQNQAKLMIKRMFVNLGLPHIARSTQSIWGLHWRPDNRTVIMEYSGSRDKLLELDNYLAKTNEPIENIENLLPIEIRWPDEKHSFWVK